nr:hypothetical protein [Tanacetum cinerariifolium]
MSLLQEAMDACAALIRRVEHLEFNKVAQALEITKLKKRVKVETSDDTVMDDESNQGRMIAEMDQDDVVVLEDDKEEDKDVADTVKDVEEAKVDESAQDRGRQVESQAKIYMIDMDHANKFLSMQEDETEPAEVQEVVDVVTTAKLIKEVVTVASEIVIAASAIINTDEAIDHVKRKAKEDPAVKRYQVLKRKPQTKAQARKNIMMYSKNIAGFKMDYFKGMSYDDIRLIFKAKFNTNVAFLLKTKEQIEEDENRALQKLNETPERERLRGETTPLARKVPVVDYQALWSLVKERFSTTKPKNFSDDFLLVTLGEMFEKPDIHAQIWKNQRTVHGPANVKGWKLLESCGVQIIMFTSTQLILLVKRKYPLTRFTLDQMLNVVRLEVEEESEVSLELLRFTRQQHQEGQLE